MSLFQDFPFYPTRALDSNGLLPHNGWMGTFAHYWAPTSWGQNRDIHEVVDPAVGGGFLGYLGGNMGAGVAGGYRLGRPFQSQGAQQDATQVHANNMANVWAGIGAMSALNGMGSQTGPNGTLDYQGGYAPASSSGFGGMSALQKGMMAMNLLNQGSQQPQGSGGMMGIGNGMSGGGFGSPVQQASNFIQPQSTAGTIGSMLPSLMMFNQMQKDNGQNNWYNLGMGQ